MSGEGPDSVPTSADPKSHRPTKRRALTPSSSQSASIDALFARPDQEIRIPSSSSDPNAAANAARKRHLPPEIVSNVQGSSAGAGSGEFHVYKASRRREYERLRGMEEEVKREKAQEEFEVGRAEREKRDEEKTRKNREKREKMKARKAKKGKGGGDGGKEAPAVGGEKKKTGGDEARDDSPAAGEDGARDGKDDDARADDADGQVSTPQNGGLVIHDDD